jgi:GNAT superfamily N-acetyltransferase
MEIEEIQSKGKKLTIKENGEEIARISIFFIKNALHKEPYAFLEDLFVQEEFRGKGYGKKIIEEAIVEAKKYSCYKIIGTSRYGRDNVHEFYKKLGFKDYGKEFRLDMR